MAVIRVKGVVSPKQTTPADIRKKIRDAVKEESKLLKKDMLKPTRTWKHKPKIEIEQLFPSHFSVSTEDKIYNWIDKGTKRHVIIPRRARFLRFTVPFKAKTVPDTLSSRKGSKGDTVVFSKMVIHPGIKKRRFERQVRLLSQKRFKPKMDALIREIAVRNL